MPKMTVLHFDLSPETLQNLRRRVRAWFLKHRRELPWREDPSPYRVWVSEIMLQQTQVATVLGYFPRFLKAFPSVRRLATADEEHVLRLWEGLGYYRRARQLHQAAQVVVEQFGGKLPSDLNKLQSLPGIGRYTAGAIASIAFGVRAPIVEANTARLYARLIGYAKPLTTGEGQRVLWEVAEQLLPQRNAGDFNQALMEIGSLVCTPTSPKCVTCPLAKACVAHVSGTTNRIPHKQKRLKTTELFEAAVVVIHRKRVLLRKCQPGERWAGLWDFPRFESELTKENAKQPIRSSKLWKNRTSELSDKTKKQTGITVQPTALLQTIQHAVTRYKIRVDCYAAEYIDGRVRRTPDKSVRWVALKELADYPLSASGRKNGGVGFETLIMKSKFTHIIQGSLSITRRELRDKLSQRHQPLLDH